MSDYFGALLRSAGAVPPAALARPMPTEDAGLVEREVELEVDAAPESMAAAQSPETPAGIEPASHTPTEAAPAADDLRQTIRTELASSPSRQSGLDDVHPVVRAALEWVAADPVQLEDVAAFAPEPQRVSDSSTRRQLPPAATPSVPPATSAGAVTAAGTRPVRPRQAPPLPSTEHDAEAARERQTAPVAPSALRELDVTPPRTSPARRPSVTTIDEAAPVPPDRIEVSIGTIHVRVDAPPARHAVVQPAPPPQRSPQPVRPSDRSGFARSRIPRV